MKILIVTDSHGYINDLFDIIEKEAPQTIIWTGDYSSDGEECSFAFPNIKFHIIRGNCDMFDKNFSDNEIFEVEGKKIFITHGHLYGVKENMNLLEKYAESIDANIVCFGHTHISYYKEVNNIKYFNPGALKDGRYGILELTNEHIIFRNKEIKQ